MPGIEYKKSQSSAGDQKGKKLISQANKAFTSVERYNAQKTWALLAEFVLPQQNRSWFEDVSKGVRRDRRVFDTTAVKSARDLAAAFHSTVTNPTMHWSKFRYKDEDLNKNPEARTWLQDASECFHDAIDDSNFDSQIGQGYEAYAALANMILFQDEDFTFHAWHLAEVAWAENRHGVVDRIYRKFKMPIHQAFEQFGPIVLDSDNIEAELAKDPNKEYDFFHCIMPRDEEEVKLNPVGLADEKSRPYAGFYIMQKQAKIVKETGYYEFPVFIGRFSKLPGEVYGFGCGHIGLADIRTVNKMQEHNLRNQAKVLDPPIITTVQNIISGDFRPSGITQVRNFDEFKEFVSQGRFDVASEEIASLRASVKECFYIDKLMLPPRTETGEMTAYEVAQRLQQMQQFLGPVLSRLNTEFLTPLVIRSLNILLRTNKLPPAPQAVLAKMPKSDRGRTLDFEIMFVNALARSQQLEELRNVQQWVQENFTLAQGKPEVLDKMDADKILDYSAKIRDIPENMVMSDEKVQQLRDQRQKQQQAQAMLSGTQQASEAARNFGQAHASVQKANSTKP